jgi:16S rRNA (uracil1498-N3)-methyltransferase
MIRIFENGSLEARHVVKTDRTHYLRNVMRCIAGQKLILINGRDGEFIGEIVKITKQFVEILIVEKTKTFKKSDFLGLIFPPIQKIDLLAKSATELGVSDFFPFRSRFCQTKFKKDKFLLNVIEAVEQSERLDAPTINNEDGLAKVLDKIAAEPNSTVFFCEERNSDCHSIKNYEFSDGGKYYALIGCEGGFSDDEKKLIKGYDNIKSVSLGRNILRTETACSAILSIINCWRY